MEFQQLVNSLQTQRSTLHTDRLSDTAEAVRQVSKNIGKSKLQWDQPRNVMIITKPGDVSLINMTRKLALWFLTTSKTCQEVKVFVDEKLKVSKRFKYEKIVAHYPQEVQQKLSFWTPLLCANQPHLFDFVITLGGDGTVLFASWLFQSYVPPVIPFHLGSLGFLTPFDFEDFDIYLKEFIDSGMRVNLRGRLSCTVYRHQQRPTTNQKQLCCDQGNTCYCGNVMETTAVPAETYQVINDLVIDRGPSPYMSLLELFGDDMHLTTVQADGLAISTPTGSTAYSLSAHGSLTHPGIHATLITPICPHTLSFRPTLVPDSMELRICVPYHSRSTAWASFDGRGRIELRQGDYIKVSASKYSFPTVCKKDPTTDWFNSLSTCLHWNKRTTQKSFAIVESSSRKITPITPTTNHHFTSSKDPLSDQMFTILTDNKEAYFMNQQQQQQQSPFFIYDDSSSSDNDDDTLQGWADEEIIKARTYIFE